MVNFSTGLNNLKTKVDDSDVNKLKTVPVDFEKLSYVVSREVVKNTEFTKLNAKVNNSENKFPDASTLIETNRYNTDKQNVDKKYLKLVL